MKINKKDRVHKNILTLAKYNALWHDNKDRKQAMLTLTIGDEKIKSVVKLRQKLLKFLNKVLARVAYRGQKVAYFNNIEFSRHKKNSLLSFNPHIHIMFYYDSIKPIKVMIEMLEDEYTFSNNHLLQYRKKKYIGYVVKDYIVYKKDKKTEKNIDVYNEELERMKLELAKGVKINTSSNKKIITEYAIRYVYKYYKKHMPTKWLSIDNQEKYEFILEEIKEGNILMTLWNEAPSEKYEIVKNTAIYIKIKDIYKY